MARATLKIFLGFLSTAVFFAAFLVVGDVLLAAIAAVVVVMIQLVLGRTTNSNPGIATGASFAIVLALTGISMMGDDIVPMAHADITGSVANCACKAAAKVQGPPLPFHAAPKTLAPAPGPV